MSNAYLHAVRDFELESVLPDFADSEAVNRRLRILDIGAGTGRQAAQLQDKGFDVVAVDLPASAYAQERVHPIVDYDGRQIPLASGTIDVVFSSNVLEHVPDVEGLLGEMKRVLAPGGVAIHVLPTPAWRWWTTLTHYPWVAKRIVQRAFARSAASGVEKGVAQPSRGALRSVLLPARHGERGTTLTEGWYYSEKWWRRTFESAGFRVVETRPVGLFYTGSMLFAERISIRRRQQLSHWLGSACRAYLLSPAASAVHANTDNAPEAIDE